MNKLTFGRKYKPKTMEKRELIHIDEVMEYLDTLKTWEKKEIQAQCVMILLYIHKKFDISKPDALIGFRHWVQTNEIDLRIEN